MFSTRPIVRFSVEHPWIVIAIALVITIALIFPLFNLEIQPDVESLLPDDLEEFEENVSGVSETFDKLLFMVKGDELFTVETLQLLEKTMDSLKAELPVVQTVDPFSMVTLAKAGARLTAVTMSPGGKAPVDEKSLEIFTERLNNSRFAPGLVCSADYDALAFYFTVEKEGHYLESMEKVYSLIEPLKEYAEVYVTGTSPFSAETEDFLTHGFIRLLFFVILTILISYYIGFRSKRAVFLPITLVLSGTVFALGIMSLAGFQLTIVSIISPPLILTLGSSYSIHVMNAYYSIVRISNKSKKEVIVDSVSAISGTVLLASFTTLLGLMSLLFATIPQTREFAVSTALGVLFSAILSISLLPAFLVLQSVPKAKKLKSLERDPLSRFLVRFGPGLVKIHKQAIIIIVVVIAAFVIITPHIEFNTSASKYFPPSSSVIVNLNEFQKEMGGYEEIKINLSSDESDFFLKTESLEKVYSIEKKLVENRDISYIFSFPQYLHYASSVMTGGEGSFDSKALNRYVSKLFKAANPDSGMVNENYSEISILLRVFNYEKMMPIDEKDSKKMLNYITGILEEEPDIDFNWEVAGTSLGFLKLSQQMKSDFLVSTLVALLLIGILTSIVFKSAVKGLLSLIPLMMGILSSMILMVIFNIPLDMTTIMVSCITIGVGVDDAIHFLLQHRRMAEKYPDDRDKAVYETIIHTGRPIVITTLSIVAGLLFLALAQFQPIRYFGLLIVFTLLTACFSTIVLLPSLTRLTGNKNARNSTKILRD